MRAPHPEVATCAHVLSTSAEISRADRIVVLDGGRISEDGSDSEPVGWHAAPTYAHRQEHPVRSGQWLTHLVSVEETHTQVQNAFTAALETEGLLEAALERAQERAQDRAGTGRVDPDSDDGVNPILLAVSDNGSQMISGTPAPS